LFVKTVVTLLLTLLVSSNGCVTSGGMITNLLFDANLAETRRRKLNRTNPNDK
jgi:hypothetical protein